MGRLAKPWPGRVRPRGFESRTFLHLAAHRGPWHFGRVSDKVVDIFDQEIARAEKRLAALEAQASDLRTRIKEAKAGRDKFLALAALDTKDTKSLPLGGMRTGRPSKNPIRPYLPCSIEEAAKVAGYESSAIRSYATGRRPAPLSVVAFFARKWNVPRSAWPKIAE